LVTSANDLAHNIGLSMVAELVETAAAFTELLGLAAIRRGTTSSVHS
jgi:EAL domain-containing protein (putative c-di-GMP-specific phosphodiesterase class I)